MIINKLQNLKTKTQKIVMKIGKKMYFGIVRYDYRRLIDIKSHIRIIKENFMYLGKIIKPQSGSLSWKQTMWLAYRNLVKGRSKMAVTVGGVAVGIGAVVLLVSFGYGLQGVVTQKIIWPDALRVAEVTSESSKVKINSDVLGKIKVIPGVEKVDQAINLAGQVIYKNSKVDTVVTGLSNNYLAMADIKIVTGKNFSKEADKQYDGTADIQDLLNKDATQKTIGEVAGVATESAMPAETIDFRLRDETYIPAYDAPAATGKMMGWIRGSILDSYRGEVAWGGVYDDSSGLGRVATNNGKLQGKWIKAKMPIRDSLGDGVYTDVKEEKEVYLDMKNVNVLSAMDKDIEKMLERGQGVVLGTATQSAQLVTLLEDKKKTDTVSNNVTIKVWQGNKKEIIVSQALVKAWNSDDKKILGSEVEVSYLVTSSVLPQISGRVLSEPEKYNVVGVYNDIKKPVILVPRADLESLGIKEYSLVRVMAKTEEQLPEVRSLIQSMGLTTRSVVDTLAQIAKLFAIIRFLLGSFGAIALVVALLGMFNTLTVSLLERTREIGVMKSMGTSNVDVTRLLLTEAVLILGVGGIGGLGLGWVIGGILNRLVFNSTQIGQNLFVMNGWFSVGILAASLILGVITGWYPAKRASQISALNALKYE